MPKRKRKSSLSSKQRTKNSSSLLKRPTKTSEPYVKLEKLDEDLIKKYVKKENEDYFDSLLNDYEDDDDLMPKNHVVDGRTLRSGKVTPSKGNFLQKKLVNNYHKCKQTIFFSYFRQDQKSKSGKVKTDQEKTNSI